MMQPPPPPIDRELFMEAVKSTVEQGLMAMKDGNAIPDFLEIIWEITRPGASCETIDMMDMIEGYPDADKVETCRLLVYRSADGKPLMAFVNSQSTMNRAQFEKFKNHPGYREAMTARVDELIEERFPGLEEDMRLKRPDQVTKELLDHSIDAEVESFRGQLDSIFDTWRGGDDSVS